LSELQQRLLDIIKAVSLGVSPSPPSNGSRGKEKRKGRRFLMVDLSDHNIWRSHIPSDVSTILEVARTGRFFMKDSH